jgi:[acyl-carrier-protein] S-malonyltransferase
MNSAAIKMKEKIDAVNFKKPEFEIISNVTALPVSRPEDIKKLLVQQINSKVRWRDSIIFMGGKKINNFIEIGPGKVLSGLSKRILPNSNSFSINSIDDIKKLNDES